MPRTSPSPSKVGASLLASIVAGGILASTLGSLGGDPAPATVDGAASVADAPVGVVEGIDDEVVIPVVGDGEQLLERNGELLVVNDDPSRIDTSAHDDSEIQVRTAVGGPVVEARPTEGPTEVDAVPAADDDEPADVTPADQVDDAPVGEVTIEEQEVVREEVLEDAELDELSEAGWVTCLSVEIAIEMARVGDITEMDRQLARGSTWAPDAEEPAVAALSSPLYALQYSGQPLLELPELFNVCLDEGYAL